MKIKRHVWPRFVKYVANKKIRHINKAIQSKYLINNNETIMGADKDKQISSAYDIMGKENTLIKSEKKEKSRDGYVCIY